MEDRAGQDSETEKTRTAEEEASSAAGPGECPECFGDPGKVCPVGTDGFIEPQKGCVGCRFLQRCLQLGLQARGKIRLVEKLEPPKVSGFLKRWSGQKLAGSSQGKSKE
jgi:hypothetical protein